jgi:hypothetical protein
MTLLHALTVLAVALGQAGSGETAAPPASPPSDAPAAPAPPARPEAKPRDVPLSSPRLIPVDRVPGDLRLKEGAPVLRSDRTTRCFERVGGGRWRAQCDASTKRCLVAPDAELSADGAPIAGLDRAPPCLVPGWREDDLASQGYELVPALAETPPGWIRDERQRLMQVNFDLNRRIWLGGGYGVGSFPGSDAGEATAGLRWDIPFRLAGAPALARVRAVETYAAFTGDAVDFTVVGIDASRAYPSPLVRLTTFVGRPRRFDPPLYVGGWLEAVRVETLHTGAGWFDRTSIGAAALTFDLWRSRDLASFVRLRGGAGYEVADQLEGAAWVPHAALDADVSLDRAGFHHLRLTALSEWLLTTGAGDYQPKDLAAPRLPEDRTRLTGKAEYELILAAVNDQPLSAVLDVRAQQRDDVPGLSTGWLVQGTASLRFNLWAPARRDAAPQERL